jgi:tRNA pseudouridine13 synthase
MEFSDDLVRQLFEGILEEKGLTAGSFRTKALRQVSFRSFFRRPLIIPGDPKTLAAGDDELHPGKKKWTLSFTLPRGSYGTMLVKRLMLRAGGG